MLRAAPPVVARLRMWTVRADAKELIANRAELEALLRAPAQEHSPGHPQDDTE
ncbi:hypothetical protein HNR05_000297 [Leifsonia psychrotolerans]|uniref:Uncharacterized protein n=1 Tax=Glaciibacter psychrotolerans TaxID=670054 RepID=A0A7Z0EBC4_9MICO|nr:hypothetical protein [Leifsonia psychrotolerans]